MTTTYFTLLDLDDIRHLTETGRSFVPLRLHWKDQSDGPILTTAENILNDFDAGYFTESAFDEFAYCATEQDYQKSMEF